MKVCVTLPVSLTSRQAPLESEFYPVSAYHFISFSHPRLLGHVSIDTTNIYAETIWR
ncbi:MAG TPA: hypothetical protein VJ124_15295 [Pyrinomonadaceae bacterium]|nr:hypothetical protein [Pyrinomonadaceae bacterium]